MPLTVLIPNTRAYRRLPRPTLWLSVPAPRRGSAVNHSRRQNKNRLLQRPGCSGFLDSSSCSTCKGYVAPCYRAHVRFDGNFSVPIFRLSLHPKLHSSIISLTESILAPPSVCLCEAGAPRRPAQGVLLLRHPAGAVRAGHADHDHLDIQGQETPAYQRAARGRPGLGAAPAPQHGA